MEREYGLTARQMQAWLAKSIGPSYNVAPTHQVPVLRVIRATEHGRELLPMRWGLIPYWARGVPLKAATINARSEDLSARAAYKDAWRRGQRCIFPAAGFYEWQPQPDGRKIPFYVRPSGDNELFHIGGLWDRSFTAQGEEVLSCAIITTPANAVLEWIHNVKKRMPLIIATEDLATWLSGTVEQAGKLLRPYPPELMRAHPVSTRVNKLENDDAALLEPVAE